MSDEFVRAVLALVEELPSLSSLDRADLLERIHDEDSLHRAEFAEISTDDEEQSVRLDIAKGVIAKWLEDRGK